MSEFAALVIWKQILLGLPLLVMLAIGAYTDVSERKVYNKVTYTGLGVGLLLHGICFGWLSFLYAFLAALATFMVGLVLYALLPGKTLGGGDIKILTAVAGFLGASGILIVTWYSVVIAGILGLLWALWSGYLKDLILNMFRFMKGLLYAVFFTTKDFAQPLQSTDERARFPFALAILCGAIAAYLEDGQHLIGFYSLFVDAFRIG